MGDGAKLGADQLDVNDLPAAGDRFEIGRLLGSGICSNVYVAADKESGESTPGGRGTCLLGRFVVKSFTVKRAQVIGFFSIDRKRTFILRFCTSIVV